MSDERVIEASAGGDRSVTLALESGGPPAVRHVCDVLFALGCIGALTVRLYVGRSDFFTGDDWPVAWMGLSPHRFIEAYNGHLSITYIAIYRAFAELFGINNILPLRTFAELTFIGIAVCLYCIIRSRVGALWALPAAVIILFYPNQTVAHSAFNHYLALIGGLLVAWMLTREERRFDLPIFVALSLALTSSSVAVAFAMGSCVFLVLTWPHWRRWIAIAIPSTLWLIWYFRYDTAGPSAGGLRLSQEVTFVWRGILSAFVGIAFNNHVLGALLGITFVVCTVLRCRHGRRAAAHPLSWFAAACGWWIALSQSLRAVFPGNEYVFRFRLVTSVFLILAFLPTDRLMGSNQFAHRWASRKGYSPVRIELASLAVAALLAGSIVLVNTTSGTITAPGTGAKYRAYFQYREAIANQGPDVVPDTSIITSPLFALHVGEYRDVVNAYGFPTGTNPTHFDQFLVSKARIDLQVVSNPKPLYCVQLETPLIERDLGLVFIVAKEHPVNVRLRLVDREWIELGRIGTGQRGVIKLPSIPYVEKPWQIEATGGCATYSKASG